MSAALHFWHLLWAVFFITPMEVPPGAFGVFDAYMNGIIHALVLLVITAVVWLMFLACHLAR